MLKVTKKAAEQIQQSIEAGDTGSMALRIAVKTAKSGEGFQYAMGFDEVNDNTDIAIESEGIKLVIANDDKDRLSGATLDFVEMEPGQFNYVFINPNDPAHEPPTEGG